MTEERRVSILEFLDGCVKRGDPFPLPPEECAAVIALIRATQGILLLDENHSQYMAQAAGLVEHFTWAP